MGSGGDRIQIPPSGLFMKEIIFLSSIQWDFLWQRHQIFATLFYRAGWKTVYVESTGIANPNLKGLGKVILRRYVGVKRIKNPRPRGLSVVNPLVLPPTYRLFRRINRRVFVPRLVKKISSLGLQSPVIIAYSPTDTTLALLDSLPHRLLIYDCVVNFEAFPGAPSDIGETEEELVRRSDFVVTDSQYLYRKMKEKTSAVYRLPPGVDFKHFARAYSGPIREVKRLCFFGGVRWEIDLELILKTAEMLPQREFVFIGPLLMEVPPNVPRNIVFHGPVAYGELPLILKDCHALLLPYRRDEFTRGIIPAKFFESLATGKPLIVSGIEENIRDYLDLVYPASTPGQMREVVLNLPEWETEEKVKSRMRVARENSWERRFETLVSLIEGSGG